MCSSCSSLEAEGKEVSIGNWRSHKFVSASTPRERERERERERVRERGRERERERERETEKKKTGRENDEENNNAEMSWQPRIAIKGVFPVSLLDWIGVDSGRIRGSPWLDLWLTRKGTQGGKNTGSSSSSLTGTSVVTVVAWPG